MAVKVVIVDDSAFFRQRIAELLESDSRLEVVGTASNGKEGIEQVKKLRPDVVTMDVEMPQLNGIEAVRIIMRECPTKVLMLSSLTQEGARVTLQALEAGAVDYLSKDMRAWMDRSLSLQSQLTDKLVTIARQGRAISPFASRNASPRSTTSMVFRPEKSTQVSSRSAPVSTPRSSGRSGSASAGSLSARKQKVVPSGFGVASGRTPSIPRDTRLLVIGSSTGGPAALQEILTSCQQIFRIPSCLYSTCPKPSRLSSRSV